MFNVYRTLCSLLVVGIGSSSMAQVVTVQDARLELNERSFLMGFTTFPYDFSVEAQLESYEHVNRNGDIVAYHYDRGIPWQEALAGDHDYHANLIAEIDTAVASVEPGKKVFLALTPQSQARRGELALYWNEESEQPLPRSWARRSFDHHDVSRAYLNFARYLLDRFNPDYFVYAIESNGGFAGPKDREFTEFTRFLSRVYPVLKSEYPDVTIMLSVEATAERAPRADLLEMTRELLTYSDVVGVSSYPYLQLHHEGLVTPGDPANIAQTLFTDIAALAPDKPFAITEAGYAAETMVLPSIGFSVPSSAAWQREYVAWLCEHLNQMEAEFLIWFVSRDYDLALERVVNDGFELADMYYIWRDNGLLDGDGKPRSSYREWRSWLTRKHVPADR